MPKRRASMHIQTALSPREVHPQWHQPHESTSPRRHGYKSTGRSHHKHNEESAGLENHNHYWCGKPTEPGWRSKVNDPSPHRPPRSKVTSSRIHETTQSSAGRSKMTASKINHTSTATHDFGHPGHLSPGRSRVNQGTLSCTMESPHPKSPAVRHHATHKSSGVAACVDHTNPPPPPPRSPRVGSCRPTQIRGPVKFQDEFTTNAAERLQIMATRA
eukprot:TRINITY_DN7101_c0_g1_i1.p2 TRINITY_DN7101_c0_g1~~TRINITY_DN7101_c0_g1_i1.p2  ORF type:complete len:239 (+),score=60.43 TRINITY_DN7101_c0_g1_i1:72-719(+)